VESNVASHDGEPPSRHRGAGLLVVVATYNERDNLPRLVAAILDVAPESRVLVIDDASPDGTGEWARRRAVDEPRLRVIERPGKMGLGSAIVRAMRIAVDEGYESLINLDGDSSHDPAVIPELLGRLHGGTGGGEADLVIGSRYVAGGGTQGWPARRKWMSFAVNTLARNALRLPVRDCSSGYRCFRVAFLKRIDLSTLRATGYAFHEESLWRLKRAGARIAECPITFVERRRGQSKINAREAAAALFGMLRWGWLERCERRPSLLDDQPRHEGPDS